MEVTKQELLEYILEGITIASEGGLKKIEITAAIREAVTIHNEQKKN